MRYGSNTNYVELFGIDDYIDFVIQFIELLSPNIVIERFVSVSPTDKLIAPRWNKLKNFEIVEKIEKEMAKRNTWQGRLFS
jgi:radical SAM superfamily enzyme